MAHYERRITGDVDAFLDHLDAEILGRSVTAQAEARSDHTIGDARMSVRAYERYSAVGSNRVSLCVSVLSSGGEMAVSAVAAGGSQAMFFKLNTFGEEAFLQHAVDAIGSFSG